MNKDRGITPESVIQALPQVGAFSYLQGLTLLSRLAPPIVLRVTESKAGFYHGWIDERVAWGIEPTLSEIVRISQLLFSDILEFEYLCYKPQEVDVYLKSLKVPLRTRRWVFRLIQRKRLLVMGLLSPTFQEIIQNFENGMEIFASEAEFWRDPRSQTERNFPMS